MCNTNWIELARICIHEGICGLNWILLGTDWFVFGLVRTG